MKYWEKHIITHHASIKEALATIDRLGIVNNDLFVTDEQNKLVGSLSDGDIRRAMLAGLSLNEKVQQAMFPTPLFARTSAKTKELIAKCTEKNIRFVPVLNDKNQIVGIIDIEGDYPQLPIDAIIMAGGKGSRLLPLTQNLPKPLLKVGDKPIIEHNIDRLIKHGISSFYISINYLGHMLKDYLGDGTAKSINISYIEEEMPMGTIGSVKIPGSYPSDTLLIMNSDLLTNINFFDFYNAFVETGADLAVAATTYTIEVPYAVMELSEKNHVRMLKEKPTYKYHSNAGIYLLKKELLELIPDKEFFDITDLIEKVIQLKKTVYAFPIMGYWMDIGKMEDYQRAQEDIKYLKL